MSSGLCSQGGLVLATAMVVSSTVIFLTLSRQKNLLPPKQSLRSCLSSSEGKRRDKKKKKVQFAENVKETNGNGEKYRKEQRKKLIAETDRFCRNEMPPNRIALYNGILRDRVHKMQSSY
ncbi:phospholipase D family protein [Hibiscus syriacus]|uniref:Phospholipase D family protein n=1 Tax=Hibiscus syriacus TaxID=106335 RepID=A0A6A2WRF2_HIBSY|nr:uncharacterized protein LOC120194183 [Hibiscus syriacus]KAE8656950.1 phospholipase D family protein [Hibiscus syriacus]